MIPIKRIFEYTVTDEYASVDIKTVMKKHFNMSSELIKRLKATEDGIVVNGERKHVNYILQNGDVLRLTITEGKSEFIVPVKIDFEIVYEDEDIMIVNKPAGIATHPSQRHFDDTLANGIMYYFEQKGEERTFRAVNRLDKDTSGLMCIAKNSHAHDRLCKTLHESFERRYMAIVEGEIKEAGTVDAPIGRVDESIIQRCITKDGQYAVTHYRPVESFDKYTVIELLLETGRTHQIRVHMSHIGHPLLGDWLYGTEDGFLRTALHSSYISLIHPVSGEKLEFSIPMAEDMQNFLKAYRNPAE